MNCLVNRRYLAPDEKRFMCRTHKGFRCDLVGCSSAHVLVLVGRVGRFGHREWRLGTRIGLALLCECRRAEEEPSSKLRTERSSGG